MVALCLSQTEGADLVMNLDTMSGVPSSPLNPSSLAPAHLPISSPSLPIPPASSTTTRRSVHA